MTSFVFAYRLSVSPAEDVRIRRVAEGAFSFLGVLSVSVVPRVYVGLIAIIVPGVSNVIITVVFLFSAL